MPLISVGDTLPLIGRKLGGQGVDWRCEPGFSQAIEGYNKINRLLMLEHRTAVTGFFRLAVHASCFTLDRRMLKILAAKHGGTRLMVAGRGVQFIDGTEFDRCPGCGCVDALMHLGSEFPTHRDLDRARLLFAVSDRPEDVEHLLLVIGEDENGDELRTTGAGTMHKGIVVPIIYAECDVAPQFNCGDGIHRGQVSNIRMLRKPRTKGYVQLWGLDEYYGSVYWITTMAPDEESPALTRYQVQGVPPKAASILVESSIRYVPLYDPNDVSLIQQQDAYEEMAQGMAAKDAGDYGTYQTFRNAAVALIRKDRDTKTGADHKLPVSVRSMPMQGRTFNLRGR